ncbi:MAG TPA: aspartate aminotransferase family protein [Bacteroidales bacterium]|nr:aspartate aminotransferase family protein [Bacteroidales bacterium]
MSVSQRQLFLNHVGQTSSAPVMLEICHAEGIYFHTTNGEKYIDLVSGVSVSSLGHNHPAVVEAVKKQADKYMHLMVYGEFVQSPQTAYADWLTKRLPTKLDNVYYVNSGSEAIEGAMKLAKRCTGRSNIIAFKNSYHGSTQGAMSILGDETYRSGFLPLLPGISHLDFNDLSQLDQINDQTAAVIVEPIQAEAGIVEPEDDFLKKLRRKCDETGAMLVFDEIQTGMGRTGKRFAFEHYGVVPDILCVAKSFGGGMPLGAFISSREVMKSLTFNPPLGHITTFGGHPVSCSAGFAAQQCIESENLISHGRAMAEKYRTLLKHDGISKIRGKGLFLAVEISEYLDPDKLMQKIFEKGMVVDQFLFCRNAFRIAPPLIIKEEEVQNTSTLLLEALDESIA